MKYFGHFTLRFRLEERFLFTEGSFLSNESLHDDAVGCQRLVIIKIKVSEPLSTSIALTSMNQDLCVFEAVAMISVFYIYWIKA